MVKYIFYRGRFVEQRFMLSSSFRCGQVYKYERYDFGHTLFCCLSLTCMFNKPTSDIYEIETKYTFYLLL
jgi:hypothetical protein